MEAAKTTTPKTEGIVPTIKIGSTVKPKGRAVRNGPCNQRREVQTVYSRGELVCIAVYLRSNRAKAVKRQEEFAVKLQTIYMIVCCVSNMKQRDLRTKVLVARGPCTSNNIVNVNVVLLKIPLNSDILKILQKDVSLEGDCQISQRKSFAPQIAVIDSMAAVLDVSVAATSDQEVENSKTSQLPRERLFSGFGGRFLRNRARSGVRPSVMNRYSHRVTVRSRIYRFCPYFVSVLIFSGTVLGFVSIRAQSSLK